MGQGGRKNNGRTAWQRIVGYLALRGTGAPPHLTLGFDTTQALCEGGCGCMIAWVREEEKATENRQRKREPDKVEVAPGMAVASLRCFRAALIAPTQGLPKRRRLCRHKNLKS